MSKSYSLADGDGLHLVIRPTGNKCWQLRYRFANCEKTLSLGKYPLISLPAARDRKVDAKRLLDQGIDPSARKKQEKQEVIYRDRNSFAVIADEWLERNSENWTLGHHNETKSRLNNYLLPSLGSRSIADIKPLELLEVIRKIERRGATHMSHRILQICGAIFNYAIVTSRADYNITIGLSKALKPHKTKNFPTLRESELPDFLNALENLDSSEQNKLAFRLLLLTAVRTGELRYSKWENIDFNAREWRIPAEITKMRTEHFVPLSRQALEILYLLREITGHSKWLVPTQCGYRHEVMSENTINDMIKRMGYQKRIVGHGFRSLFSTTLNERGFNRDAIERQLAHMERNKVRAAYNRAEYINERRHIMQWWADFIDHQTRSQANLPNQATPLPPQPPIPARTHHANVVYQVVAIPVEENGHPAFLDTIPSDYMAVAQEPVAALETFSPFISPAVDFDRR